MTNIVDKNAPTPRGNGKIRRVLPALGLIAAAISGYNSQTVGSGQVPEPEKVVSGISAPMIVQEATLLHFARAQGVGDALRETTGSLPEALDRSLRDAAAFVETGRTETTAYRIDMAYSAGYLEAIEGSWDADRLDGYLNTAFRTEIGLLELADQATLRWADRFGLEEGRALVIGAMALTVANDPFQPIWSGTIEEGSERGRAFVEVSSVVRNMLDALHLAAYVPPLPEADVTRWPRGVASVEAASEHPIATTPDLEI